MRVRSDVNAVLCQMLGPRGLPHFFALITIRSDGRVTAIRARESHVLGQR